MALSNDLIMQFVKATKDNSETKKESTAYGTIVEHNGSKYVQLDGAETPTPISSTTNVVVGERVTVMIKDHTAIVTGNLSSPSARTADVKDVVDEITEFEIAIGNKVDTEELEAEKARIDDLVAENAAIKGMLTASDAEIENILSDTVTINKKLDANAADIENLKATKLDASAAVLEYAKISDLEATDAELYNLQSTYATFSSATADRLAANEANINKLSTDKLDASAAAIKYATIEQLDVEKGRIDDLEAEIADIDTLMFGSASGTSIQTSFANTVIAQLGDAQIKSAMIENVSASKINSGAINTNNVNVGSEDGKLLISDETIQISDDTRVRVQIGKDASNDYSINIWDESGNLMFSKGGITDSAIKEAIIRNDMVSDTANIAAHKLDIDSLFEEINGSTKTIKSTRIYLDDEGQTLDVAFESMTTDIEELQNGVSSQGTQITAIQGQIASKVWQQDINTAVNEVNETTDNLSTQYEEVVQNVDGLTATVANHTSEISKKANSSTVTEVSNKVASMETDLSGFRTTVSETYATKTQLDELEIGGRNLLRNTRNPVDKSYWQQGYITLDEDLGENVFFVTRSESNEVVLGTKRIRVIPDETYTVSVWLKRTSNVSSIDLWFLSREENSANDFDHTRARQGLTPPADIWTKYTWTFITNSNAYEGYLRIDHNGSTDGTEATMYYTMVKMEKGDKATDWTPAPEDLATERDLLGLDTRVTNAETKIIQNEDNITQIASKTDINTDAIASLELTAESLTSRVNTTDKNLSELEIGGRNLVIGSSAYRKDTPFTHTSSSLDGMKVASAMYMPVEIGETYTIQCCTDSVWGRHNADGTATGETHLFLYLMTEGQNAGQYTYAYAIQDDPSKGYTGRRTWTYTVPDNGTAYTKIMFRFDIHSDGNTEYTVNWWDLKVERGTKATDWTPAPEDMATADELESIQSSTDLTEERIATAESIIQQLSDCISTLVTDGNGQSLMTQTDDGWTFSTGDIQSIMNSTSESLDTLVNEVGDIDSTVGILQQAVNDLGVLSEYVKITTYEDEPCIELGETDSDFKLLITNTRIMFMEGTGVPAYISNQSLHIKKAVIEEELQQGEFIWKARSNGNLGLIWKGATN